MLIATLPSVHQERLLHEIIEHPLVGGVRFNVGSASPYGPEETLSKIVSLVETNEKKFWLDLKGRQLRIVQWAAPHYGKIILNHSLEVDCPAEVFFRGDESCEVRFVRDNTIFVEPDPPRAVGAGQAINIHGDNLKIKDYLTSDDIEYLAAACRLGVTNFMLSFVESEDDIDEVTDQIDQHLIDFTRDDVELILKIESPLGLELVDRFEKIDKSFCRIHLMATRDDMMINIGDNKAAMIPAVKKISEKDAEAIVASRIFSGLENGGSVTMGDWSDLHLMKHFGYKNFMLSDGVSHRHFAEAMAAWEDYRKVFPD